MYILFVERETDTRAKVLYNTARPDLMPPFQVAEGIAVETMLELVPQPKKNAQLYINPQTLEQWYEYTDREPTQEESVKDISTELAFLKVLVQFIVPKWSKGAVAYEKKDITRLNTGIYQCLTDHVSTADLKPTLTLGTYWVKLVDL